jgi:hypothetical protein
MKLGRAVLARRPVASADRWRRRGRHGPAPARRDRRSRKDDASLRLGGQRELSVGAGGFARRRDAARMCRRPPPRREHIGRARSAAINRRELRPRLAENIGGKPFADEDASVSRRAGRHAVDAHCVKLSASAPLAGRIPSAVRMALVRPPRRSGPGDSEPVDRERQRRAAALPARTGILRRFTQSAVSSSSEPAGRRLRAGRRRRDCRSRWPDHWYRQSRLVGPSQKGGQPRERVNRDRQPPVGRSIRPRRCRGDLASPARQGRCGEAAMARGDDVSAIREAGRAAWVQPRGAVLRRNGTATSRRIRPTGVR